MKYSNFMIMVLTVICFMLCVINHYQNKDIKQLNKNVEILMQSDMQQTWAIMDLEAKGL